MNKLFSVAIVKLTEEQIFQMRHAIREADAASESDRPGMLIGQIWAEDEPFMLAGFVPYEVALKIVAAKNSLSELREAISPKEYADFLRDSAEYFRDQAAGIECGKEVIL